MPFFQVLSTAVNQIHLGIVNEENSTMTPFTPLQIWKWYTVLVGILARSSNTKISQCLCANMRSMQRI